MEAKVYPNLETMCRLCLKENSGIICIFNKDKESEKFAALSIPMRFMVCAALEVHDSDDLPKKICTECRLQLEKSYYFRKLSLASDAKIRKHLRLIAMGKTSNVFNKKIDGDDVLEFQESLDFIKEQEDQQKQIKKLKIESFMMEMKLQNENDLKKIRENLKATCREELIPQIREEVRKELRTEIQIKLEENLRKEVTEQCISQAKESLRNEVREECRQLEIKCLLEDLQIYLNNKKKLLDFTVPKKDIVLRSLSPVTDKDITPKIRYNTQNSAKTEVVRMEFGLRDDNGEKENFVITEDMIDELNEEDCDSEGNFLIYDHNEGSDVKKKNIDDRIEYVDNVVHEVEYEDDEYTDPDIVTLEKMNVENIDTNDESGEATSMTSYRIEDNEDGEIKFLKKSHDDSNVIDEDNPDQDQTNENVMVINITEGLENEYVEQFEEKQKHVKTKKQSPNKTRKSSDKKAQESLVTTTTSSTLKTTFLTKTYVNPLQRSTDTPKIFKCYDCPMVFSTKFSLDRHLRSHLKIEKTGVRYQCSECHIVVSCSSALRRHMYVHCEEKPFSCNVCEKSFVQREILKRHMLTHTGIRPHQCPHCERSFAQRINLTQHVNRTHLEEPHIQQHPCYLCPKRFNHASGLSRHLASHSGVTFQCSECNRNFSDRSAIKRHINSMHNNARPQKGDAKSINQVEYKLI